MISHFLISLQIVNAWKDDSIFEVIKRQNRIAGLQNSFSGFFFGTQTIEGFASFHLVIFSRNVGSVIIVFSFECNCSMSDCLFRFLSFLKSGGFWKEILREGLQLFDGFMERSLKLV